MRTTINLPEELVHDALVASHCKTKTKLFKMALENIIQKHRIAKIKKFSGKIDLKIDLDTLRKRK